MKLYFRRFFVGLLLVVLGAVQSHAVQLKISRDVLQRTLRQQLFSGPNGRYYLKGNAQTPCYVYAEDAQLNFVGGRVVVQIKTQAKLGKAWGNSCLGISLSPTPEVSLAPDGEGEVVGFRDAKIDKVVDHKELNFLLTPFLNTQLPSSMNVNAADLLRKAMADSSKTTGYRVTLEQLKIHSMQIKGDDIVVDFDGDLSVR
jgi:hypothetical protein